MTDVRGRAELRASHSRTTEDLPRPTLAFVLLMALVVTFGQYALFISGPAAQAAAQEQLKRSIAEEDRDVCGQFGIRPGSSQFDVCSRELAVVRQKQADREKAAAQGIL